MNEPRWRILKSVTFLATLLLQAHVAGTEVVGMEIDGRGPPADSHSFGRSDACERLHGRLHVEVDPAKARAHAPGEFREQLEAIAAERRRMEQLLPEFVDSLALPGRPYGRFKFHAAQRQPWLLYASQQMLSLCVRHGVWEELDERKKKEWLELIFSTQDVKTGLFVCSEARNVSTAYYRSITLKLASRLESIGVKPPYPLPHTDVVCPSYEELPARLAALPWNRSVYSAGSEAGHWGTTRLQELRSRERPIKDDPYVMQIIQFLEKRQDPQTGFWGNTNRRDGLNGLLKTLTLYKMLDRPLPSADLIADSILKAQSSDGGFGDACTPWNALELMTFLVRQVPDRRAEMQRAGLRFVHTLHRRRQADGLYSFTQAGCIADHAGVKLCARPLPISDLVGTSQTLSIIKMVQALFKPAAGPQK